FILSQLVVASARQTAAQLIRYVQRGDGNVVDAAELHDGTIERPIVTPARLVFRRSKKRLFRGRSVKVRSNLLLKWPLEHFHADTEPFVLREQPLDDLQLY